MKNLIQVPVSVTNMKPMADKSWRLTFDSEKELSGEEVKVLVDNYQGLGWLVYSPNEIQHTDIPEESVEGETKSQSSRLRSVIYILWCQQGKKGDFELYYRQYLETLITFVKSKLAPEE